MDGVITVPDQLAVDVHSDSVAKSRDAERTGTVHGRGELLVEGLGAQIAPPRGGDWSNRDG